MSSTEQLAYVPLGLIALQSPIVKHPVPVNLQSFSTCKNSVNLLANLSVQVIPAGNVTHQVSPGPYFASALDKNTQNQLARGRRLRELLKQSQSEPLTVEDQIATIYTGTNGYLDALEIGQVRPFLEKLRSCLKNKKPGFQEIISSTKTFTEEAEALLKEAIQEEMRIFVVQEQI